MGKSPHAIEIAASFAGTLLQVTRVRAGGSYRIGTARGVDLPLDVSPLTSFPLVGTTPHGFVVRCPAGVSAVMYTRERAISIVESELALEPGARVDLAAGRVTISISQVDDVPTPLELRPIERRPFAFAAASLVAHLAVVILAMFCAELDPIHAPAAFPTPKHESWRLTRLVPPKPPPQKRKAPRRAAAAHPAAAAEPAEPGGPSLEHRPAAIAAARRSASEGGMFSNPNLFDFSAIIGDVDLAAAFEGIGPIYNEEEATRGNFGNSGGHFDPTKDPKFDSVKTGRYATTGTGRGAGAHYKLRGEVERPEFMALTCDDNNCVVSGTMNRFQVRDVIEHRYLDLLACYTHNAKAVPRVEVSLQFEIGTDGRAGEVAVEGLEPVGNCVRRLVARAKFPTADQPTLVKKYTMAFWRNAPA